MTESRREVLEDSVKVEDTSTFPTVEERHKDIQMKDELAVAVLETSDPGGSKFRLNAYSAAIDGRVRRRMSPSVAHKVLPMTGPEDVILDDCESRWIASLLLMSLSSVARRVCRFSARWNRSGVVPSCFLFLERAFNDCSLEGVDGSKRCFPGSDGLVSLLVDGGLVRMLRF
ncbi:uncharacterized protein BT62DRAFT_1001900 [Guyanagaster necrorhizus]|uniref:Uncharacterized protein n=1 Tax=Guyanagaster necrorhizus TaxID=856835 RepID=A0A9P7VZ44_9AGAR|nr:uncharacterized protein BT62DRAFT_1001900 [Guyanagaster necrorhizus MCA 3950]KAG7449612.1 hypothetical protein BT62DRAFT_1001900 [Guyanagaster necrorhizus MCA 3950]